MTAPRRPVVDDRTTTRFLVPLCVVVLLARTAYAWQPLRNDEGGYLHVARRLHPGGEFLYGDYFVDRPPLLLLLFRVAAVTEWDGAIRVLAVPFALMFVLAAWRAGTLLGGQPAGRWAAVTGAALMCCPLLAADQADGELFGAALVMASLVMALRAWRSPPGASGLVLAGSAGALAAAAPLVKQNLLEGLLFPAVLVLVTAVMRRRVEWRETHLVAGLVGTLLPVSAAVLWFVHTEAGPEAVWHDLVGFRRAAIEVIWSIRPRATVERGVLLLVLGLVTGLLAMILTWYAASRPALRRASPEHWAVAVLLLFGLGSIVAGGSYWPAYLLQLGPAAVLAVAMVAPVPSAAGRSMRAAVRVLVGAAVLSTVVAAVAYAVAPRLRAHQLAGEWLAASGAPGDTAFVAYGAPSVLEAADLPSPYPYLWSVPMRTLDPEQERLRATLSGPRAPVWIVEVNGFNSWGIDAEQRLRRLVTERYRLVADVCATPVWLRADLTRPLAPTPRC